MKIRQGFVLREVMGSTMAVVAAEIFPEPRFSDHAPCLVEYRE